LNRDPRKSTRRMGAASFTMAWHGRPAHEEGSIACFDLFSRAGRPCHSTLHPDGPEHGRAFALEAEPHAVEPQVHHRYGIEGQELADEKTANDGDAQRAAHF